MHILVAIAIDTSIAIANLSPFFLFSPPSLLFYLPLSSLTTNAEGPFRATRNIVALDNASTFVIKLPGGRDTNGVALLMS